METARSIQPVLASRQRVIRLSGRQPVVFVGDTHGDLDATETVFSRHLTGRTTIVFLGDTVDRGPSSKENLDLILRMKVVHPKQVHLLMGNHEAWSIRPFFPADFWNGLPAEDAMTLATILEGLPFAASHPSGVLGLHGALPALSRLEDLESVVPGSEAWKAITWGDWLASGSLPIGASASSRPLFDQATFAQRAAALGVRVLIRSHQPFVPMTLYQSRCLTIFTSSAYGGTPRRIAILPPARRVHTVSDLQIEEL